MNKHLVELKEFLLNKGVDEKELLPYLESIDKNMKNKKYGLVWEEQEENILAELKGKFPVLNEIKEREIITNIDKPMNLLIEGDNLESLYVLNYTHGRMVDVIYIDPPYNTGNEDFIYNDKIVDKEDVWKHSKWLSFMNKRLRLAKELLKSSGVIFISIDDHEMAQLKLLCDEIFGENNNLGIFIVKSTPNARDYGHIGKMHEYVLMYAKDSNYTVTNKLIDKSKKFKFKDQIGGFNIHPLYNSNEAFDNTNRPNLYYPFYLNPVKDKKTDFYEISLEKHDGWLEIYPPKSAKNNVQFVWRWGKELSFNNLNKEIVGYKNLNGKFRIVQKMRHDSKIIRSILDEPGFTSRKGTAEIEEMFGKKTFSFPKPVELIKTLLAMSTQKDSVVVDFFCGSGTVSEALLKLNQEDGGNRKFILCTNNENNICEEITYQRINKVINGYLITQKNEYIEALGGNLKYYKTNLVEDKIDSHDNIASLIDKCTSTIQIKEECYNTIENNELYDIVENKHKLIYIIKKPFIWDYEIDEILEGKETSKQEIIVYTTKSDYSKKGISVKEFPQHIVSLYERLRKSM